MARTYCYEYPRPAVTVDFLVFCLVEGRLQVLLIRRKKMPFANSWAIPGGFIEMEEPIESAVRRELREETGLEYQGPVCLIGVYGAPDRDPRGRTISLAHGAVIRPPLPEVCGADDAEEACWAAPFEKSPLAFDHDQIMADAQIWLVSEILKGPAGLALLPSPFNDGDVIALFHAIHKPRRSALAWKNRLVRDGKIEPTSHPLEHYQAV